MLSRCCRQVAIFALVLLAWEAGSSVLAAEPTPARRRTMDPQRFSASLRLSRHGCRSGAAARSQTLLGASPGCYVLQLGVLWCPPARPVHQSLGLLQRVHPVRL